MAIEYRSEMGNVSDTFADLSDLKNTLQGRIAQREEILQAIADGDVAGGIQEAQDAGIELFDGDLSTSVLQGQLRAIEQLVAKANEYDGAILRVNTLVDAARLSELDQLESRVNTLQVQNTLLQADTALLELDFPLLKNLLEQATPIAEKLNEVALIEWVTQLKADDNFLHSLPSSVPGHQTEDTPLSYLDVNRWKEQLIDRHTALEHGAYQKLKKAVDQYTNSRLLKKYKSLHFAFSGRPSIATPAIASDSPSVMEKDIRSFDTFLQTYWRPGATEGEINEKFEEVELELQTTWGDSFGQRNLWKMLTMSFFADWPRWIEQSHQIGEVLKEIEELSKTNNLSPEQESAFKKKTYLLVARLNELLVNSESIAVYRWHDKYGPQFDKLTMLYSRFDSSKRATFLSKMNDTAFRKSKQGFEMLNKLSSPGQSPRVPIKQQLHEGK